MSIMPRTQYQQGINRQFLRRSRFDFMSPEFVNLSEQPIYAAEIYATNSKENNEDIFGFQGRYNEMRYKENQTAGALRNTLNYWHLGRVFALATMCSVVSVTWMRNNVTELQCLHKYPFLNLLTYEYAWNLLQKVLMLRLTQHII